MTHIEELQENIRRLKHTISQPYHAEGYIANCKRDLAAYEKRLAQLQDDQRERHYAFVGHYCTKARFE
ncbi:hypothetical protein [Photobacterium sp. GSS17]|uniref:hypothetical protein n=1 Tax=Photobacterium sp. GSS17 TaxID=3020715 RepID=UPI002362B25E|nr:hypothetical protein [Photobacterium sp. GSS17]